MPAQDIEPLWNHKLTGGDLLESRRHGNTRVPDITMSSTRSKADSSPQY